MRWLGEPIRAAHRSEIRELNAALAADYASDDIGNVFWMSTDNRILRLDER